jgi:hypothetical protein
MPNLVKSARNMIEFIEKNNVIVKYDNDYSTSHSTSEGEKLKELVDELNEAIDASTELPNTSMLLAIEQLTESFKKQP